MRLLLTISICAVALIASSIAGAANKKTTVSFAEDVQPILNGRCVACHQPGGSGLEVSGLDLRSYAGLMKGTKFGPVVVPGDDMTSNLVILVDGRADKSLKMPHGTQKKLSSCDRDVIHAWVREGAQNN